MRRFWQVIFLACTGWFFLSAFGVWFDRWQLDRFDQGFLCVMTGFFFLICFVLEGE